MGFAKMYSGPTKIGRGRFQVSEGVAPSERIHPDEELLTLFKDDKGSNAEFFEVVLLKGTIVSSYQKTDGRYVATYCRGTAGYVLRQAILTTATGAIAYEALAHAAGAGEVDLGVVWIPDPTTAINNDGVDGVAGSLGQAAHPIGVLTKDAFRPFDKGDNEGISFICQGYVEWPLVKLTKADDTVVFDNSDLKVGDFVKPDALGRPVKWLPGEPEDLKIGQVIAREDLAGALANYDYGFLNYMQLPYDTFTSDLVSTPYEVVVFGESAARFGVRQNIDGTAAATVQNILDANADVTKYGALGAVRVNLINL